MSELVCDTGVATDEADVVDWLLVGIWDEFEGAKIEVVD